MKIIKRNGTEVVFDITKIISAITKANNADDSSKELSREQIVRIAASVEQKCSSINRASSVEEIQDMVEQKINVVSHKNLYYLSEKTNQEKFKKKIVFDSLQLPINQNKSIGKLILYNKDKAVASYPLYSEINVKKMNFLDKLLRVYKSLI